MPASALLKLSRALHGAETLEVVMQRVRTAITEQTRYNRAYLHLVSEDQRTFEIVGWVLPNEEMVQQRLATIDVSQDPLIQKLLTLTEPLVVEDLRLDPLADQAQVEFFGNRTSIVVPMFEGDARIGPFVVPTFADQGVMVPTKEEYDFFLQVASLLAVVIGRLRAEQARRQSEEVAARNLRMNALGRMAGEVAHDINNVLVTILANVDLAVHELGDHSAADLLVDVREAALRAGRFTRQLLAYSRGQVLSKTVVRVEELLGVATALALPSFPEGVELGQVLHPGVGHVMADGPQLERVLMNLLVNARDAVRGRGRVTLEAEVSTVDEQYVAAQGELRPGRYLLVSVTDDGEGMTREMQARIFEPFFTTKPADRGTGLGLSVVEGIVRQHDGYVHVYSEPGLGTTFKVYLPLGEEDSSSEAPPAAAETKLEGPHRILVVDDDGPVRRTVERILVGADYQVQSVASAEEALIVLRQGPVELLLTDVVLSGTDGVELGREVQKLYPALRILFMTGYARGKLNELRLPHLSKPFAPSELLRLVYQALSS